MTDPLSLADRFVAAIAAIAAGDQDAIRAIYAPDARIWHNTDPPGFAGQTVDENLRTLQWLGRVLGDIRYDIVRREAFGAGFLQQHVLRGTVKPGGAPFALPACIICTVKDGRIVQLDEYLDSAGSAPLLAAAEALRKAQ